jgi:hypothetical protein
VRSVFKLSALLLPAMAMFACVFDGGGDNALPASSASGVQPGFYRGDYGILSQVSGLESEMILDANGHFQYFEIHANEPFYIAQGTWNSSAGFMVWSSYSLGRAYEDDGMDFDEWHALKADTSLLRRVTDSSFERLEIAQDTLDHSLRQWISYRRSVLPGVLAYGRYEYTETYTNYFDTVPIAGRAFIELHTDGSYLDGRFANNIPVYEFEGARWIQAGSFLLTKRNRARFYDSTLKVFEPWYEYDSNYVYVAHIRDIQGDSFQNWVASAASYQGFPYWADYRRLP